MSEENEKKQFALVFEFDEAVTSQQRAALRDLLIEKLNAAGVKNSKIEETTREIPEGPDVIRYQVSRKLS